MTYKLVFQFRKLVNQLLRTFQDLRDFLWCQVGFKRFNELQVRR
jgi:hypothetical protein